MSQAIPQICYLSHAGFHMLGEPVFRLSEGTRIASMVIPLESQDAVLPLRSVAREFKVDPGSADGQMLDLIERALDFVVAIKPGDKFPSELIDGEASWEPNDQDRLIASSRVRHNLVRGVFARMGKKVTIDGGATPGWEQAAKNRAVIAEAIAGAADMIDGIDGAEVITRVGALCEQMAYIESLRRMLSKGIAGMREKLLRLPMDQVPTGRQETVKQVQTLAKRGLDEFTNRFNEVDVRLDNVLTLLRDMPATIAWLHRRRDLLFRGNQSWAPVFTDWNRAPARFDDFLWKVVERSYLFLAPRFMPFQEWISVEAKMRKEQMRVQVW